MKDVGKIGWYESKFGAPTPPYRPPASGKQISLDNLFLAGYDEVLGFMNYVTNNNISQILLVVFAVS